MSHHAEKPVSRLLAVAALSICTVFPAKSAHAQAGTSIASFDNICLAEARRAEAQHGIPAGLLQSITRVEAGRKTVTGDFLPWAWTLNDRGEGLFFDSRDAAMRHLQAAVDSGDHSVDVGCMQVNTKWHMEGFLDLGDMLDPVQNADYAAGFLLDLHEAHQSWDEAVKHYHSAEPEKNLVYHRRVLAELETFLANRNAAPQPASAASGSPDMPGNDHAENNNDASGMVLASAPVTVPVEVPMTPAPMTPAPMAPDSLTPVASEPDITPAPVVAPAADQAPGLAAQNDFRNDPRNDLLNRLSPDSLPTAIPAPVREKQPNLAPHWDRVEQFRRMLAQGAG